MPASRGKPGDKIIKPIIATTNIAVPICNPNLSLSATQSSRSGGRRAPEQRQKLPDDVHGQGSPSGGCDHTHFSSWYTTYLLAAGRRTAELVFTDGTVRIGGLEKARQQYFGCRRTQKVCTDPSICFYSAVVGVGELAPYFTATT